MWVYCKFYREHGLDSNPWHLVVSFEGAHQSLSINAYGLIITVAAMDALGTLTEKEFYLDIDDHPNLLEVIRGLTGPEVAQFLADCQNLPFPSRRRPVHVNRMVEVLPASREHMLEAWTTMRQHLSTVLPFASHG
jgi:hypothetical protein